MGRPLPVKIPTNTAAGIAPAASTTKYFIQGMEIVQTVQSPNNDVILIAGKQTVVRLYLNIESPAPVTARGRLKISYNSINLFVDSSNQVTLDPDNPIDIKDQRLNEQRSMQFHLPPSATMKGIVSLDIAEIVDLHSGDAGRLDTFAPIKVEFVKALPMKLRLIGFRYQLDNNDQQSGPRPIDRDRIQSWLRRAYPVADLQMVYTESDAPKSFRPNLQNASSVINAQVTAIRNSEVTSGEPETTKYYGLVYDNGTLSQFMRGAATDVPDIPDLNVVACGPTGSDSFGWDTDGSYGDWYCGHELAHTYGRNHPGFCNGNSSSDPAFPYPQGLISKDTPFYIGYDVDSLIQTVLPGDEWKDVMTYCDNQWISKYTYEGIYQRMVEEHKKSAGGVKGTQGPENTTGSNHLVNVIAMINLDENTGEIAVVTPIIRNIPTGVDQKEKARLTIEDENGEILSSHDVPVSIASCSEGDRTMQGQVNSIISIADTTAKIKLFRKDQLLDTYEVDSPVLEVENLRVEDSDLESGGIGSIEAPKMLRWDAKGVKPSQARFNVEVSTDEGQSWQTLAISTPSLEALIQPDLFPGLSQVMIRVTETNGIRKGNTIVEKIELR